MVFGAPPTFNLKKKKNFTFFVGGVVLYKKNTGPPGLVCGPPPTLNLKKQKNFI